MEVVYSDKFFAESKASDRVAVGVHVRGVYGDSHRVGQHHHHHSCLTGLTRQTNLNKNNEWFMTSLLPPVLVLLKSTRYRHMYQNKGSLLKARLLWSFEKENMSLLAVEDVFESDP